MSDQRTSGGFADDPTTALAVTGSGGCCGNAPRTTDFLASDPAAVPTAAGAPCCGTPADATASGSCCGAGAKADAVAAGAGCCG